VLFNSCLIETHSNGEMMKYAPLPAVGCAGFAGLQDSCAESSERTFRLKAAWHVAGQVAPPCSWRQLRNIQMSDYWDSGCLTTPDPALATEHAAQLPKTPYGA